MTFEELGNSVNTSNPPYTMNMAKVPAIYSGGLVSWMNAIYDMNISPAAAGAAVVISGEEYQRIQNHINSPGIQRELERQAAVLVKARG